MIDPLFRNDYLFTNRLNLLAATKPDGHLAEVESV
jgi:hypothetical protein